MPLCYVDTFCGFMKYDIADFFKHRIILNLRHAVLLQERHLQHNRYLVSAVLVREFLGREVTMEILTLTTMLSKLFPGIL
jgi:hypothetical protein